MKTVVRKHILRQLAMSSQSEFCDFDSHNVKALMLGTMGLLRAVNVFYISLFFLCVYVAVSRVSASTSKEKSHLGYQLHTLRAFVHMYAYVLQDMDAHTAAGRILRANRRRMGRNQDQLMTEKVLLPILCAASLTSWYIERVNKNDICRFHHHMYAQYYASRG
jgi:hypothetical protein